MKLDIKFKSMSGVEWRRFFFLCIVTADFTLEVVAQCISISLSLYSLLNETLSVDTSG